jgi:hypothetical protein
MPLRNHPRWRTWLWVGCGVIATGIAVLAAERLVLPKVAKPEPTQPEIGLETDTHLNKNPPRKTKGLDLIKMGWTYDCMECHQALEAKWDRDGRAMVEHGNIKLNHGNNRFCLNCHHAKNRNVFVDYDGSEIAETAVVDLCARCHGTTHRDWEAGVHGRQNGHWDKPKGTSTKLTCIQCHDPHDPKFKAMEALRAPDYPERAAGSAQGTDGGREAH